MRPFFVLTAAMVLVGCGGSESGGVFDPNASFTPDGGVEVSDSGTEPPPDAGSDSGKPKTDGGDAGNGDAAVKDNRIDPIEVGHAWTYNVTVLGFFPACSNGVFVSNTLQSSSVEGKTALHVQSFCPNAGVVKYAVEGDRVYSYIAGDWKTSLDSPVTQGHTWSDGFLDYKWEKKSSITTPAGTFSDCWSATTVASYTSYILLCRGVGPVKWHYEDGFGNGYEAVLTAKNF
jgi:hypothetical protein